MSDETKDKPEETEEEANTSGEGTEEEAPEESPATEDSAADAASESSDVDESDEAVADEPAEDDAASSPEEAADEGEASEDDEVDELDEPPPAAPGEPGPVETEELDRDDVETIDHIRDSDPEVLGVAAFFDHPDHLMYAAAQARDAEYVEFDAYSPFPIHGMDDAMGLGRSWIPWVTFCAGSTGFLTACILEFGIMGFDWPMVFGGKPFIAWPSFVPVMFELTVLFAGVTTAIVMLIAAGCFRKPFIIDPEITNDRFVLWISSADPGFDRVGVIDFMKNLNPMEIRTLKKDADK